VDTQLLEEVTGDLKTHIPTTTEEHHQIPKTEVLTGEIVATKLKVTEEAKTTTKAMIIQTKTINCKYCKTPGHSVENSWKLQAKKAAMEVNNENEFHEDHNEQSQEEDPTVTSVFNTHSYSKNQ
jgi:uncharacterized protein (UPF0179 family)